MTTRQLGWSRLIVGLVLVVIAALMFLLPDATYSTAGAVAIGILGLISIAISRR